MTNKSAARPEAGSEANWKRPALESSTEKEPDDWVCGDDPMTGAQASYLKTPFGRMRRAGQFPTRPHQGRSFETDRRAQGEAKTGATPVTA
jgi:Protein of unknown function (DUF3072)